MAGRLRHKNEMYGSGNGVHTPWGIDPVLKQYDSLLSKCMNDANAYRVIGFSALIMLLISLGANIYMAMKPKNDLVVVAVDDAGNTRYYGSVRGKSFDDYGYSENVMRQIVNKFIVNTYTVSTDSDLMYANYSECLYFLDTNRREAFIRMVNTDDPFSLVGREKKNAVVDTIIPLTSSSYQVEWYVNTSDLNGSKLVSEHYRGVFSFKKLSSSQYKNLKEEELLVNSSGCYITDYNIQKIRIEEFGKK